MRQFFINIAAFFVVNRKVILIIAAAALFVLFGLWSRTRFSVGIFQPFAAEETPTTETPARTPNGTPRLLPLSQ